MIRAWLTIAALMWTGAGGGRAAAPPAPAAAEKADVVVLISADAEWKALRPRLAGLAFAATPFGESAAGTLAAGGRKRSVVYLRGGWGKISAAASAQYAIDRWAPKLLINLGTCGGFEGAARAGDLVLVTKTVVYDIVERMGDPEEAIADYATALDLSWLAKPYPEPVASSALVSADRDLDPADIARLRAKYGAVAGDWESGAIAWTAARAKTPCLILRVVSDVVSARGSEAYGNLALFQERTRTIMGRLLDGLPAWVQAAARLFPD